jgi:hypothetical protein
MKAIQTNKRLMSNAQNSTLCANITMVMAAVERITIESSEDIAFLYWLMDRVLGKSVRPEAEPIKSGSPIALLVPRVRHCDVRPILLRFCMGFGDTFWLWFEQITRSFYEEQSLFMPFGRRNSVWLCHDIQNGITNP